MVLLEETLFFKCFGHENILATHKNTFELTKDTNLTKQGDCIVGVNCNFDSETIRQFAKKHNKLKIQLACDGLKEEIIASINPNFSDDYELVFRIGEFTSDRTLGIRTNKSAKMLNRKLIELLKNPSNVLDIQFIFINTN